MQTVVNMCKGGSTTGEEYGQGDLRGGQEVCIFVEDRGRVVWVVASKNAIQRVLNAKTMQTWGQY